MSRDKAFQVYRLFNASGELLYVGCSHEANRRMLDHRRTKDWFHEVTSATFEHFETADQASDAERTAVQTENPKCNGRIGHYAKQVRQFPGSRIDHLDPAEAALIDAHRKAFKRIWSFSSENATAV